MSTAELKCVFASLPKTTRGQPTVLGKDPKGENFLYANKNHIFIRDINNAAKCDLYSEHTSHTTMAKYSPSRFYIASGDSTGKVRIWDTVNAEHILKNEYPVLGGMIKDISWDPESKKIAVCGEGRDEYAKCITYDSGNTIGSLSGHNKSVNSVAYKPTRPYRMVTASEDFRTQFYEGPPFKYKEQCMDHSNFVNCVRYAPGGEVYITVGQEGKAFVYDGKTAEQLGCLGGDKAHNGGIYALDFNDKGTEVITVSGDKTAKIWNVESREMVALFEFGKELTDMQVGCLWSGDNILTVSLSGFINFLDRNNPSTPIRIQKGHNKPITAMAMSSDRSRLYTSGADAISAIAHIFDWDVNTGHCEQIQGKGHTNQIVEMVAAGDLLITVSMDDTIRFTSMSSNQYDSNACKLPSQPNGVAALPNGLAVVSCINHIAVVDKGNLVFQQEVKFGPTSVDIHPGHTAVAFGGCHDLHIFELSGTALKGKQVIKTDDDVMKVKFSPDGAYLTVCTGSKRFTYLYDLSVKEEYKQMYKSGKQTGKIFSLAWSPDSQHFATGSLDGSIVVWGLETGFGKNIICLIKDAHKKANVSNLEWAGENTLFSSADDSCINQWSIKFA